MVLEGGMLLKFLISGSTPSYFVIVKKILCMDIEGTVFHSKPADQLRRETVTQRHIGESKEGSIGVKKCTHSVLEIVGRTSSEPRIFSIVSPAFASGC